MSWYQEEYEKKVEELRQRIRAANLGAGGDAMLDMLDLFAEHTHSVMETDRDG